MSDMPTCKVKVNAATADEASKAAKDKCRKDGCDVRGALMPASLSEGEWEVAVIVTEMPKSLKSDKKTKLEAVPESDED